MAIYIVLIIYIFILSAFLSYVIPDRGRKEHLILTLGMGAIFLLLALKKETVGIDIAGYKEQYILSATVPWNNFRYVYFEPGYILLMKLFSKSGLSFQFFAATIYCACCGAYYRFIDRYSKNVMLSLLIFICYQFLVFYTSGLRQALAMSICIYGFLVADDQRKTDWVRLAVPLLLVGVAVLIHESALLFYLVILFLRWKPDQVHWALLSGAFGASIFIRPLLLRFINMFIRKVNLSSSITLGGNFIFLLGMTLFCIWAYYQNRSNKSTQRDSFLPIASNVLLMALIAQILFSGSSLLRSSMYLTMFLIPGLPNALKCFERRIEILITWLLTWFLIALFWSDTLSINQLNLWPYLFFWQ